MEARKSSISAFLERTVSERREGRGRKRADRWATAGFCLTAISNKRKTRAAVYGLVMEYDEA